MGNPISENIKIGTIGELLVQTRLLQYDVQAAPPIIDSGNDLIAVRGECFKGIQVKTTKNSKVQWNNLPEHYHVLAFVNLVGEDNNIYLDHSAVYLIPRESIVGIKKNIESLKPYLLSQELIDRIFV